MNPSPQESSDPTLILQTFVALVDSVGFDALGRITAESNSAWGVSRVFGFDGAGRLVKTSEFSSSVSGSSGCVVRRNVFDKDSNLVANSSGMSSASSLSECVDEGMFPESVSLSVSSSFSSGSQILSRSVNGVNVVSPQTYDVWGRVTSLSGSLTADNTPISALTYRADNLTHSITTPTSTDTINHTDYTGRWDINWSSVSDWTANIVAGVGFATCVLASAGMCAAVGVIGVIATTSASFMDFHQRGKSLDQDFAVNTAFDVGLLLIPGGRILKQGKRTLKLGVVTLKLTRSHSWSRIVACKYLLQKQLARTSLTAISASVGLAKERLHDA